MQVKRTKEKGQEENKENIIGTRHAKEQKKRTWGEQGTKIVRIQVRSKAKYWHDASEGEPKEAKRKNVKERVTK